MSGEGRSNLFVRSSSEEEGGRISRTISLSSVKEEDLATGSSPNETDDAFENSYSSLSIPSKSKRKSGKLPQFFDFMSQYLYQ